MFYREWLEDWLEYSVTLSERGLATKNYPGQHFLRSPRRGFFLASAAINGLLKT